VSGWSATSSGRALVLGSGGFTGIAWEVGVLQGLRHAGFNVTDWDLVVGTSAGSFVGAHLLGEGTLDMQFAAQVHGDVSADEALIIPVTGAAIIRVLRLGRRLGLAGCRASGSPRSACRHSFALPPDTGSARRATSGPPSARDGLGLTPRQRCWPGSARWP